MRHITKSIIIFSFTVFSLSTYAQSAKQAKGYKTSALDNSAWNCSEWISVANAPVVTERINDNSRSADGANWFKNTVKNDKKVKTALWMTTGLGVYDLYVNGTPIGKEILKPGFTHYAKTKRSFTYDVSDAFKKDAGAENSLSVQVTPGWWADKIITPGNNNGMIGKKCAFRGVLKLIFTDGTTKLYGTDTNNWKAGIAGKVKHAAIFDGEIFDDRETAGYDTSVALTTPEVNKEFNGVILPSQGAEVYFREDLALKPTRAYIWDGIEGKSDKEYGKVVITKEYSDGDIITLMPHQTLVVDFGQNCAAVPSFVFQAEKGAQIHCEPAELLNDGNGAYSRGMDGPEGSVHRLNLRTPNTGMMLDYIFGNNKPVCFQPRNTFYGYRFISIVATEKVTFKSIRSIPITSITKDMEIGNITTGNESINRLISNTQWGQRSNYLSIPTDCPQRNERLGWTADTQVFAETGTFFANTQNFFHKWMGDMRDTQSPQGGFPGVAPFGQYCSDESMRLGWADAGVIVPYTVWKQFGNVDIINENWTSMEKFINHANETRYTHNLLFEENKGSQWADWLSYEPLETCSGKSRDKNGTLPEAEEYWNYLSAAYWLMDAEMMRDMAKATSRDTKKYELMMQEARSYILDNFLTTDGKFKLDILNTMQTPALFALKNKLIKGKAREEMITRLRENFKAHGDCLQTGFLGTSILMPTLTENGMIDVAYNLLFQRKNPSWLYSIDNGATTIWERWNSYMIENGMGPKGMNSFNHYAYGCVCEWIWETAAGISADPAKPGFKHIIMSPVPDKRLGYINAQYKSAAGTIKSSWKYKGNKWIWKFTIPKGATASVTIPGSKETKEYKAGTYTVVANM
ncbi:alpha-L-rhamnosidase [Bacteroides luti]|uniref:alpha-L-rhamnosidase n=1 Tax=Bacteroides luti TaxID=1297750 RepID=A0A1M4XQB9_9BACE|nr:family 78 glycoside hydrolase catalytic domain [Bacteroides luti]SHE95620.1 alpha-L-rhamnosidase [Bacteroides luti]